LKHPIYDHHEQVTRSSKH